MARTITAKELEARMRKENLPVLDIREADEFAIQTIRKAVNLPLSGFPELMNRLDKRLTYYVVDASGDRSDKACRFLEKAGYSAVKMEGGMAAWQGEVT